MTENASAGLEEEIIRVMAGKIERLPVLEAVLERHAQGLSVALKNYCGMPTEIRVADIDYQSCGEALEGVGPTWLAIVCEAAPWNGQIALAIDPGLLFSVLELLLGGRASSADGADWTPRSFTSIEKRLAMQLCQIVLAELGTAFAPVSEVEFSVGWIESSPQAVMIAPAKAPCARISLDVSIDERGGQLAVIMPLRTLDPVKAQLSEVFLGEQLGPDEGWAHRMKESLNGTEVALSAVLRRLRVPLSDALGWKVGQVLDLGIAPDSEVTVSVRGRDLMRGAMGRRRNGAAAIRVSETTFATHGGES